MCVVSMVMDHYEPILPRIDRTGVAGTWTWPAPVQLEPSADVLELKKLLAEFREALAAAKAVDRLTNQPDCEDPEKAKLIERVAELDRRVASLEAASRKPKKRPRIRYDK